MGKDVLETLFHPDNTMLKAHLLGKERLQGLSVNHWRGLGISKKTKLHRTIDVWVSNDSRFPVVMKVQRNSSKVSFKWEITHLRLVEHFPDYIFTTQIHPVGGLLAQIKLQYKPLWMTLIWFVLLLIANAFFISAIMNPLQLWKKVLKITFSFLVILGLLWFAPKLDQYINHIAGIPVLLLIVSLTAIMLKICIGKFKIPGDVRLFSGIRWPVIIWAVIALLAGFFLGNSTLRMIASSYYGLNEWSFAFLPQTLIGVIIYALAFSALEEIVFRGYITGLLSNKIRELWLVNIIQATIFAIEHIPKYLNQQNNTAYLIINLIYILIFGAIRLKYRSLAASWIVHYAYNVGYFYAIFSGLYYMMTTF